MVGSRYFFTLLPGRLMGELEREEEQPLFTS